MAPSGPASTTGVSACGLAEGEGSQPITAATPTAHMTMTAMAAAATRGCKPLREFWIRVDVFITMLHRN
ncbi:hypothetical protein D3C77_777420 [compost metagenome]